MTPKRLPHTRTALRAALHSARSAAITVAWATSLSAVLLLATTPASAGPANPSAALSGVSLLPVAVVASTTGLVLSAGATFAVVAVEKTADGSVWLLQRGTDAARLSLQVAGGASVAVGTAVVVGAVATGWVLSAAGQAVAFVPNQIGAALLHNERVSR